MYDLHPLENIPYDYNIIMELATLEQFETSDEDEVSSEVPDSLSEVVDEPSLETFIIPKQQDYHCLLDLVEGHIVNASLHVVSICLLD